MCGYFSKKWKSTEISRDQLAENHRYFLETWELSRDNFPVFQRFDSFQKAQPPRHPVSPCRCGSNDRWRCWHEVVTDELLGEGRVSRVTGPWGWDDE
jgi:hypothetical protein